MDSTTSDEGISRCRVRQRGSNSSINVGDRSRIAALSSDHLGCKQEVVFSSPIASKRTHVNQPRPLMPSSLNGQSPLTSVGALVGALRIWIVRTLGIRLSASVDQRFRPAPQGIQ